MPFKKFVLFLSLIIISIFVYLPSFKAPFVRDDIGKLILNPDIKNISNILNKLVYPYSSVYNFNRNDPSRPLVYFSYSINYFLGGLSPFGYHAVNFFFHLLNVFIIFFLIRKLCHMSGLMQADLLSYFVSLLFAVHPINTTTVSYVFNRSDVFMTFFYLFSLLAFLSYPRAPWAALILYCFSLLSKQSAITLPAVLLFADFIFICARDPKRLINRFIFHTPFWLLSLFYFIGRYYLFGAFAFDAEGGPAIWPRTAYILTMPLVLIKYLIFLVIPHGLSYEHFIRPLYSIDLSFILSMFSLFLLTIIILFNKSKQSFYNIYLFCFGCFILILLPTSSFFPTTTPIAENRLYLPGIFIYFIIATLIISLYRLLSSTHSFTFFFFPCSVIIALSFVTYNRNLLFRDPLLLWTDVTDKYPECFVALKAEGDLYFLRNDYLNSVKAYRKAYELYPHLIFVLNKLGLAYAGLKDYDNAIDCYQKYLLMAPNDWSAHVNLGFVYLNKGALSQAVVILTKALEINPNDFNAYYNLGVTYIKLHKDSTAIIFLKKAYQMNPVLFNSISEGKYKLYLGVN